MIFLVLLYFLSTSFAELHEGDSCYLKNGSPGLCIKLNKCPLVLEKLKIGHGPDLVCGYEGFTPIVCCPTSTSANTTPQDPLESEGRVGVIARQKCAEYSQYVYTSKAAPLLTTTPQILNVSLCGIKNHAFFSNVRKAYPMELPYMAVVGYELAPGAVSWRYSGTLISETFVLTAAYVAHSTEWGDAVSVHLGQHILGGGNETGKPVTRRVIERISYPKYKLYSRYHDIALLRLESPVSFDGWIRPACLNTGPLTDVRKAILTQWDRVHGDGTSNIQMSILPLVDQQTCNASWTTAGKVNQLPAGVVDYLSICAEAEKLDTCQDDIGGALVIYSKPEYYCMYDVIGVTGFGKTCNGRNPGIYTRVSFYLKWIESIVWGDQAHE